jgi:hypothetical protein
LLVMVIAGGQRISMVGLENELKEGATSNARAGTTLAAKKKV